MSFPTPVLFITFNRLDTTRQVFEAIRAVQPETLYLFSDAGREGKPEEQQQVVEVRKWLLEQINWPCKINTLFLQENMGPRYAIGHAVNWMFEQQVRGIVLEHDCLPDSTFFSFCEQMLERYNDHEKVMHITGNNFLFDRIKVEGSYYFSNLSNPTWGWATWKRAWKFYNPDMPEFPLFLSENGFDRFVRSTRVKRYYKEIYTRLFEGEIFTWDYQWSFAIWRRKGLCITPASNLVSNIGYGVKAIHTSDVNDQFAFIPISSIQAIAHPSDMDVNSNADNFVLEQVIRPPFLKRIRLLKKIFKMQPE